MPRLGDVVDAAELADDLREQRRAAADALDPIEDPLHVPDDGRALTSVAELSARLRVGRVDVVGVRGAALGHLVARLAREGKPVVVAVADAERGRALLADLEHFTSHGEIDAEDAEDTAVGDVLLLTGAESSPYADVSPDRRGALARVSTLAHVTRGFSVLVLTAAALARRVMPRATLVAHTPTVRVDDEVDRDPLVTRLVEAGYLRVPVVEDPGTLAVRGALLDVWPPSARLPVRIELYGDMVASIKTFDPDKQRTLDDVREIVLPPAREAILDANSVARARARTTELCDAVDMPTSKARQLAEDIAQGRAFFGADGFLPAFHERLDPIFAYLPEDARWVIDDPASVARGVRDAYAEPAAGVAAFAPSEHFVDEVEIAARLAAPLVVHRVAVEGSPDDGPLDALVAAPSDTPTLGAKDQSDLVRAIQQARARAAKGGALDPLIRRVAVWREAGLRTIVAARTVTQAERLAALLRAHEQTVRTVLVRFDANLLDDPSFGRDEVAIVVGPLTHGAILASERLALVTEEELFGARGKRKAPSKSTRRDAARPFLEDLRALSVGDLVVHVEHGVGRYLGLEHRDLLGPATIDADGKLHQQKTRVDLLVVEYGGGRLYLPVHRLDQIQKYSGEAEKAVRLDKLGGSTFTKTKQRVERDVRRMADELLKLYAERKATVTDVLPPIDDGYREFEATFPFEETEDQARAIEQVLADLEKPEPMDRLVCGDVGFGKTEVAVRAAFRAASNGRQVAVLCPTTVLAQQHYHTFASRLAEHPITVAPLSRFQDKAEQTATLKRIKEGKVDIVIGTHRLLSKDVHFKDLGLLVVDEEQRFGVTHKERIKQLRTRVHVITLTATPIPRTLQMAVGGLRDLSLITTPPVDRRAIRTVITRWDDKVVREALTRELSRGGQVFYVHNRVGGDTGGGIYEKAQKVTALVPTARVGVAHGQMSEDALEAAMLDFVEGRIDVLCATAIVESGLDIPRANTIIIDGAHLFGLSQLYQLRGRVGRSKERAYCYLVVPPEAAMTDEARARIEALEKHTELGSGFKIAALDLEIRGAGDLLGGEQSGNVASVGLEMFASMLEDAVAELRGDVLLGSRATDPELSLDVEAYLPDDYVDEVGVRLSLYKRLAQAEDDDAVRDLAAEMEDRFGPPPREALRFVQLMHLKCALRELRALGCEATTERVTLHLASGAPIDAEAIGKAVAKKGSPWKLSPDMRLSLRLSPGEASDGLAAAEKALDRLAAFRKS